MKSLFKFRAPPKDVNIVDEFWDQLLNIPANSSEAFPVWMLHHPIDVALHLTHRHLKDITGAEDQLDAFVNFWVPSDVVRRERLYRMLAKQACWERTSWIPFTPKVRVLPQRYAHNAFMFSALVATEKPHVYGHVSGRYINSSPTASNFCKNNSHPPIMDGKWLPSEAYAMQDFIHTTKPQSPVLLTTVRLLRSMILTLLSPSGHTSFVIGIPTDLRGRVAFNCLDNVRRKFAKSVEVPAYNPDRIAEVCDEEFTPKGPSAYKGPTIVRGPTPDTVRGFSQPRKQATQYTRAEEVQRELRRTDDAVTLDLARGLSLNDQMIQAAVLSTIINTPDTSSQGSQQPSASTDSYRSDPSPSHSCRDDSPSTSWGSDSSSNCNVD